MRYAVATLADYASVREGLLTVVSAGVSVVVRPSYPSVFGCSLAFLIDVLPEEIGDSPAVSLPFTIHLRSSEGEIIAEYAGTLGGEFDPSGLYQGVPLHIPAALDLRDLQLPHVGLYSVDVSIGDLEPLHLPFRAATSITP